MATEHEGLLHKIARTLSVIIFYLVRENGLTLL